MKTLFLSAMLLCGGALMMPIRPALAQEFTMTSSSELASVTLPAQTMRFKPKAVPKEINDALATMMKAGGSQVKRGRTEVLGWTGGGYTKKRAGEWKARIASALKKAGWEYEEGEKIEGAQGATMVSALRTTPTRKALIGFWAPADEALVLAWTEMLPAGGNANGNRGIATPDTADNTEVAVEEAPGEEAPAEANQATPGEETPAEGTPGDEAGENGNAVGTGETVSAPTQGTVIEVSDEQFVLNVAKSLPSPKVTFPKLAPLPGKVRGYVYGSDGKPLKGAAIGVASTAVGGAETSVSGKTDARGYYELMIPFGVARFYASGYGVDYGEGRLAMGLTPADGEADEFATPKGHVENWILQPYGIADRAGVQDDPKYLNNYFGGSVTLEFLDEYSGIAGQKGLKFGSTVEVTLSPKGTLMDGSKGHPFTVRKAIKEQMEHRLYLNNIPVGTYTLSARMIRGNRSVPLNLRETGPDSSRPFGLSPKQGQGSVELMFRPYSARVESATAGHGNWKEVDVNIMQ